MGVRGQWTNEVDESRSGDNDITIHTICGGVNDLITADGSWGGGSDLTSANESFRFCGLIRADSSWRSFWEYGKTNIYGIIMSMELTIGFSSASGHAILSTLWNITKKSE